VYDRGSVCWVNSDNKNSRKHYLVYSDCQSIRHGGISGVIGAVSLGGDIAFGGIVGGSMAYAAYACIGVGLIGLPCAIVAGIAAVIV